MGGKGSGNRTKSNPRIAKRAENVDPEGNSARIAYVNKIRRLPQVDMSELDAVEDRIDLFFSLCDEYDMQPLVGNLAAHFGMTRRYFLQIITEQRPGRNLGITPETLRALKNAYAFVYVAYEQALTDENTKNPVPLIFLGKATLGLQEAPSETVITHRTETIQSQLKGKTAEEVAAMYIEASGVTREQVYELPESTD